MARVVSEEEASRPTVDLRQRALIQPFAPRQTQQKQRSPGAKLRAHGHPYAYQPKAGSQQNSQGQPHAPHADKVQHKAAGAVARTLHGAAGYDTCPEHRLGKGFDAQHPCAQRNNGGIGGEDAHQLRGKHIQPHAGKRHDAHAHGGAQPCKALGHVPAVCAHGLSHQRKGGVLNAVARHVAQALGADPQTVGGNGSSAQPGHDAHQQHLCRGQGGALCRQRRAYLPHVMQAGAGNVPRAGLADAQRSVPQQQDGKGQHTADSGSKGGAQCCARYAPAQTPDREVLAEYRNLPRGVDEEKVEDDVQYAGEDAMTMPVVKACGRV